MIDQNLFTKEETRARAVKDISYRLATVAGAIDVALAQRAVTTLDAHRLSKLSGAFEAIVLRGDFAPFVALSDEEDALRVSVRHHFGV